MSVMYDVNEIDRLRAQVQYLQVKLRRVKEERDEAIRQWRLLMGDPVGHYELAVKQPHDLP